jgi:hypothetical protein
MCFFFLLLFSVIDNYPWKLLFFSLKGMLIWSIKKSIVGRKYSRKQLQCLRSSFCYFLLGETILKFDLTKMVLLVRWAVAILHFFYPLYFIFTCVHLYLFIYLSIYLFIYMFQDQKITELPNILTFNLIQYLNTSA